jgi:dolichyl-phosphate-mannose--protein O-mannosyl transferase
VSAYLLTWTGWFVGENSWNRHWGDTHPGTGLLGWLPNGIRSLINYHQQAYKFHSHLYDPHAYRANPWSWLVLGRPISFYFPADAGTLFPGDAATGCGAPSCAREILLIGTPIMYWAFVPALIWLLWRWLTTRDWRAGAVWMAFLVGWGVWLQNTRRTGFLFYMTPLMPFLVLGLTFAIGAMLSRAEEDHEPVLINSPTTAQISDPGEDQEVREVGLTEWIRYRGLSTPRLLRTIAVTLWMGLVVADFIWMWPIFTGGLLTKHEWQLRMWFPSWI